MCEKQFSLVSPQSREHPAYLSLGETLSTVVKYDAVTPNKIAQNRLRESAIRLDLRRLAQLGYLRQVGSELFEPTDSADDRSTQQSVTQEYRTYASEKYADTDNLTDRSKLTSRNVKETNLEMLKDGGQEYNPRSNRSRSKASRIMNVSGNRLYRVFREFPRDTSLIQQCAHWMRTFAGYHFFPDANHRTGMFTLSVLLRSNGFDTVDLPGPRRERAVLRSKLIRLLSVERTNLKRLWRRDELYEHWLDYFACLLGEREVPNASTCSTEALRAALQAARDEESIQF